MPRATKDLVHSRPSPMANRYCETCDKEFCRPSELKRHLERTLIHNPNARQFECSFCGSSHTQKSNLLIHERIHSNEQKECCRLPLDSSGPKECPFACSDPSSMIRHIDNVHLAPHFKRGLPVPEWLTQGLQEREAVKAALRRGSRSPTGFPHSSPSPEPSKASSSILITPAGMSFPEMPRGDHELLVSTQNIFAVDKTTITGDTFPINIPDIGMDLMNLDFNCDPNQLPVPTFAVPQTGELTFDSIPSSALFSQAASVEFFQLPSPQQPNVNQLSASDGISGIDDLIPSAEAAATTFGAIPPDDAFLLDTNQMQTSYQFPMLRGSLSPISFFSPMEPQVQMDLYNFP